LDGSEDELGELAVLAGAKEIAKDIALLLRPELAQRGIGAHRKGGPGHSNFQNVWLKRKWNISYMFLKILSIKHCRWFLEWFII
jgi:hypothetical protein